MYEFLSSPVVIIASLWTIASIISHFLKFKERFGITIYPFFFLYESKRLRNWVVKKGESDSSFWAKYASISGAITLVLVFLALLYFILNLYYLVKARLIVTSGGIAVGAPIVPIIPFVTIPFNLFLIFLLSTAIAIIPHEIAHGIVAVKEGIDIESVSIFVILGVIFGGYVKPSEEFEEELNKVLEGESDNLKVVQFSKKLYKVAGAGILANLFLALLLFGIINGLYVEKGVIVLDIQTGSPADKAGLKINDVIIRIDNYTINNVNDLENVLSRYKPNETAVIYTDSGRYILKFSSHPKNSSRAYMGVSVTNYYGLRVPFLDKKGELTLYIFLNISFLLQITIILINALPLYVTDGTKTLLGFLLSKNIKPAMAIKIINIFNVIGLSILAMNISVSMSWIW